MSENEFDQFLAFFRGLLRVNPARREEIVAELLDHLQERLTELTDQGMPHDQAVRVALEEFGDAAALAAQFVLIVSQQRRRRIMKWTASSVLAAMIVLWGAYSFWPADPVRGPRPERAVAQDPFGGPIGAAAQPGPQTPAAEQPPAEVPGAVAVNQFDSMHEIESRLTRQVAAEYVDTPLRDFLEHVRMTSAVDFYVDQKALEDLGVSLDNPVSIQLNQVRYDRLLDLALGQMELVWLVRDGYVLVTTPDKLREQLEIRVYNCRDLVESHLAGRRGRMYGSGEIGEGGFGGMAGADGGMMSGMGSMGMPGMAGMGGMMAGAGGSGSAESQPPPTQMETLIKVITTTVVPDSWVDQGGQGSVEAYYGGLLVVNHDPRAHQKIEQLLTMLREASQGKPGAVVRRR